MKFLVAIPIWKRHHLASFVAKSYRDKGLDVLIVGSEGKKSRKVAEENGCHYIEVKNTPFGNKLNSRVRFFLDNDQYTHLITVGSDNLVCDRFMGVVKNYCEDHDILAWKDIFFYNAKTNECVYSEGYPRSSTRFREPLGPGKCFSRRFLEGLNGSLWPEKLDRYPDSGMRDKMYSHGFKLLECRDEQCMIIDVKGHNNLTPWHRLRGYSNNPVTRNESNRIKSIMKGYEYSRDGHNS